MYKVLLFLILSAICIGSVCAEEINLSSDIPINSTFIGNQTYSGYSIPPTQAQNGTPLPTYGAPLHIENGDCVPLNSTVDISSLGWGVPHLSYYGTYFDAYSPENATPKYEIDMPNTASKLKNFYIDPFVFGNRTGYWYQRYDNGETEGAGNLRMFKVNMTCPVPENKSHEQVAIQEIKTTVPQRESYLPQKKAADILIARGDTLAIQAVSGGVHWWLFGYANEQQILDQGAKSAIVLETPKWSLETGNYHLIEVSPGNNSIYEEYYDPGYQPEKFTTTRYPALVSPFRNGEVKNIYGLNPQNVESALKEMVKKSIDDSITTLNVQYAEPEIQIMRIDALQNPDNQTWYNVRGYTNVANGTPLTITIDQGSYFYKMNKTWKSVAENVNTADPGMWRQFNSLIPVDYGNMFPGNHYITVSSPQGATMTVPFYVYKEPPAHYIPPQYIEYVGASPFVTPQVITKTVTVQVPGPVQYVSVTPSNEQVKAQQEVVQNEHEIMYLMWGLCLVGLYGAYRLVKWLISVAKRTRKVQ